MNDQSALISFHKNDGKGVLLYPHIAFSCTTFGRSHQLNRSLNSHFNIESFEVCKSSEKI